MSARGTKIETRLKAAMFELSPEESDLFNLLQTDISQAPA
jgi:hypothetical protein